MFDDCQRFREFGGFALSAFSAEFAPFAAVSAAATLKKPRMTSRNQYRAAQLTLNPLEFTDSLQGNYRRPADTTLATQPMAPSTRASMAALEVFAITIPKVPDE
jgi:hypothetical protein